jgi:hypothetical protein
MRPRFNRNACASSRGAYVRDSHIAFIKECHERNKEVIAELSITIEVKPKYYVRCFGKLIQVTEREAMMLKTQVIIQK